MFYLVESSSDDDDASSMSRRTRESKKAIILGLSAVELLDGSSVEKKWLAGVNSFQLNANLVSNMFNTDKQLWGFF